MLVKIVNSYKDAIKIGKWTNPGAKLYRTILSSIYVEGTSYEDALHEAYLIVGKVHNDPHSGVTPYTRSGCKYPHHIIRNGKMVLSIPGVKAAYARAKQMGVYKGEVKAHLDRHLKELGLMTKDGIYYKEKMEENFLFIESTVDSILGTNLIKEENHLNEISTQFEESVDMLNHQSLILESELLALSEKSHGLLKYCYRLGFDINTGIQVAIQFRIPNSEEITAVGDPKLTNNVFKGLTGRDMKPEALEAIHADALDISRKNLKSKGHIDFQTAALPIIAIFTHDHRRLDEVEMIPLMSDGLLKAVNEYQNPNEVTKVHLSIEELMEDKEFRKFILTNKSKYNIITEKYKINEVAGANKYKTTALIWSRRNFSSFKMTPALRGQHPTHGRMTANWEYDPIDSKNYLLKKLNNPFKNKRFSEAVNWYTISHLPPIEILRTNEVITGTIYEMISDLEESCNLLSDEEVEYHAMLIHSLMCEEVLEDWDGIEGFEEKNDNIEEELAWIDSFVHNDEFREQAELEYLFEKSHGLKKYEFRMVIGENDGHLYKIVYRLNPNNVTSDNLGTDETRDALRSRIRKTGHSNYTSKGNSVIAIVDMCNDKRVTTVSAYPPIHNVGGTIMPVNKSKWMKIMKTFVKYGMPQSEMDKLIEKYERECPKGIWPQPGWEDVIKDSKKAGQSPILYKVGEIDNTDTYKTTKITNVTKGMFGLKENMPMDEDLFEWALSAFVEDAEDDNPEEKDEEKKDDDNGDNTVDPGTDTGGATTDDSGDNKDDISADSSGPSDTDSSSNDNSTTGGEEGETKEPEKEEVKPEPAKKLTPISRPQQFARQEEDKNGVRRKNLYIEFIRWAKTFNSKNIFGSNFDKDIFHVTYPFVPHELRYFYRLADPTICVLSGNLTFFPVIQLRKLNSDNQQMKDYFIFAATDHDLRVFSTADKAVYLAKDDNGKIVPTTKLGDTFDIYIQNMIKQGDILNGPREDTTLEYVEELT